MMNDKVPGEDGSGEEKEKVMYERDDEQATYVDWLISHL